MLLRNTLDSPSASGTVTEKQKTHSQSKVNASDQLDQEFWRHDHPAVDSFIPPNVLPRIATDTHSAETRHVRLHGLQHKYYSNVLPGKYKKVDVDDER